MLSDELIIKHTNYCMEKITACTFCHKKIFKEVQRTHEMYCNSNPDKYYLLFSKMANQVYENKDLEQKNCSICLENYVEGDKIIILCCDHQFHYNCILGLLDPEKKCPMCRQDIEKLYKKK